MKRKTIVLGSVIAVLAIGGVAAAAGGGSTTTADAGTTSSSSSSSSSSAPTTPPVAKITVPALAGLTPSQATSKLGASLKIVVVGDTSNPQFGVLSQDPAAGTSVEKGTTVTVTVGESPAQAQSRRAAEAAAAKAAEEKAAAEAAAAAQAAADADLGSYQETDSHKWALVAKDPSAHVGEKYVIYGRVFQFDSATGTSRFLANTGAQQEEYAFSYDTTTMVSATDPAKLADVVEDDIVKMHVRVTGPYSYSTRIGNGNTVTAVQVNNIEVIGHDD